MNKIQKRQMLQDFHHKAASADYGSLRFLFLFLFVCFVVVVVVI